MTNRYARSDYSPDLRSETLRGTAINYIVYPGRKNGAEYWPATITSFQGDFELDSMTETNPEQVRAIRYAEKGERPRYKINELRNEVVILVGPSLSADDVRNCFLMLAEKIAKDGLMIGKDADERYLNDFIDSKSANRGPRDRGK